MFSGDLIAGLKAHVHVRLLARRKKIRGHDTDDCEVLTTKRNAAPDDGWISVKDLLPEAVCKDDYTFTTSPILFRSDKATQGRLNAEQFEEIRCHKAGEGITRL